MVKDFDVWNLVKKSIENHTPVLNYKEREVWFCSLGINIGSEQDGKGKKFLRPILIIKKFNRQIFWAVRLSRTQKTGMFYVPVSFNNDNESSKVILSQLRLFDIKRLKYKTGKISKEQFLNIKENLKTLLS